MPAGASCQLSYHTQQKSFLAGQFFPKSHIGFESHIGFWDLSCEGDAVEAWDDGDAAFNDGESPYCLAHGLCRASFAGFDSGRALLAGGVTGV